MIFVGILAGGKGIRMGKEIPKQFLELEDKPIIIHTIEKFLLSSRVDIIYIGVNKEWLNYCKDLIKKYLNKEKDKIKLIGGGIDRTATLMNIVYDIEKTYGNSKENIILTHDAVRPFINLRIIEENIDMAIKYDACNTIIPCVDTIVESKDNVVISNIPNRNILYRGQSPQTFKINLLKDLYEKLTEEEKLYLTDACKICVLKEQEVYLVKGNPLNIKITTTEDYLLAKEIVKLQKNEIE